MSEEKTTKNPKQKVKTRINLDGVKVPGTRLMGIERGDDYVNPYTGRACITWKFLCDCGTVKLIAAKSVTHGSTKSCGCQARENQAKRRNAWSMQPRNRQRLHNLQER